jgi:molecular chaperone HscB
MSLIINHFEIFNLSISFEVDNQLLNQRYRELQRLVHPDNYINASERERILALQKTAQINEAFQTLKDPLARGKYLLQLYHFNHSDTHEMMTDTEFLMAQMELREELSEIKNQPQPIAALNIFMKQISDKINELILHLNQQFSESNYVAAHDNIQQLQFFKRLQEETLALEEELV